MDRFLPMLAEIEAGSHVFLAIRFSTQRAMMAKRMAYLRRRRAMPSDSPHTEYRWRVPARLPHRREFAIAQPSDVHFQLQISCACPMYRRAARRHGLAPAQKSPARYARIETRITILISFDDAVAYSWALQVFNTSPPPPIIRMRLHEMGTAISEVSS